MISNSNRDKAIWVSVICIIVAGLVMYVVGPESISGVVVSKPLAFRFGIAGYFGLFAVWMLLALFPSERRPLWLVPAIVLCWSLFGFAGCRATIHRTPASVSVNASWGEYNRRPPGMKQYDDRQDKKTFWFRALIVCSWAGALIFRFSLEEEHSKSRKIE